jgi:hypothetical protein
MKAIAEFRHNIDPALKSARDSGVLLEATSSLIGFHR